MTTTPPRTAARSVTLRVEQSELDDLDRRLALTRFPHVVDEDDTTGGVPVALLRRLVDRWRDGFDWRAVEAEVNRWDQYLLEVDGRDVHYVHQRAGSPGALPVVLLHGWPDSFLRYRYLVDPLNAAGHDVVVPSLPGFGLSVQPDGPMSVDLAAASVAAVVDGIGYPQVAVHGGDFGSAVAEKLATLRPDLVAALHLTDVPWHLPLSVDSADASDVERVFLQSASEWAAGASYFSVQAEQPTTLSAALADSPVGLAAWLVGRFRDWTDREHDLDELLTHVGLYWFTGTIRSSMRLYSEGMGDWSDEPDAQWDGADDGAAWTPQQVAVPTAFALFPHDIGVPPRELAARFFDVQRFTLMPRGGHFGALEEPELLAADLVAFLADLPVGTASGRPAS